MIDQELGQGNFLWNSENSGGSFGREKPPAATVEIKSKKRGRNGKENIGGGGGSGGGGGESSDHEIHIWTERERRKKMRNMFTNLHALLPQLPPKADKSTIVDEAVNYIKTLQQTLQKLQKQKLEKIKSAATTPEYNHCSRETFMADQISSNNNNNNIADMIITNPNNNNLQMFRPPVSFQTWTSPNVVVNICGNEAQISICSPKDKLGFFTTVCYVLEKHKIEIMSAHVSSNFHRSTYMIQARVNSVYDQNMKDGFTAEEIYKQAAGEIMLWVSST